MTELIKGGIRSSFFCIVAVIAALLFLTAGQEMSAGVRQKTAATKKTRNSFATPDFAFPQTVAKNAGAEYRCALRSGDARSALKAAIQLDVADAVVSADNYKKSVDRFDSLSNVLAFPYDRLAMLLEARVYADMWSFSRWVYNDRKLPLSPVPENADEWSTPIFASRIMQLVEKAMTDSERLASVSISEIAPLLTDADDAVRAGFSTLDFMTLCAEGLLSPFVSASSVATIPFGSKDKGVTGVTPEGLAMTLTDGAIARHADDKDYFLDSFFCGRKLDLLSGDARRSWLEECVRRFSDTPYGARFVADYAGSVGQESGKDGNEARRAAYMSLREYQGKFPEAAGIGYVESMIASLETKRLNVDFSNRLLPGRENRITVSGANVFDFNILVYRLPGNDSDRYYTYASLSSGAKLVRSIPVKISGTTPDQFSDTVTVPPLEPGYYAFVPSVTSGVSGILQKNRRMHLETSLVSGLSVVTASDADGALERDLYVVSAVNQKPVAGASVKLYPLQNGKRGVPVVKTTGSDGRVPLADGQFYYLIEDGADFISGRLSKAYFTKEDSSVRLRGEVMTDLSVYRPDDRVGFAAVIYTSDGRKMSPAAGRSLRVYLLDANRQKVDSLDMMSDAYGRLERSFALPGSGLLGNWMVSVRDSGSTEWVANGYFEVAEYKTPTFLVTVDSASGSYRAGETLVFSGKAMTYAGMPVGGGKVAYTVRMMPLWWRMVPGGAQYGGEAVTAADGSFSIKLPTQNLAGTLYAGGAYSLSVSVTDQAGETQPATPLRFSLGDALRIAPEFDTTVCADTDTLGFKVRVIDLTEHPVRKTVYYRIKSGGRIVASGEFVSPLLRIPSDVLQSGGYDFEFSLDSGFCGTGNDSPVLTQVTVWRHDDVRPPVTDMLWIPERKIVVPPGERKVRIKVGSSYPDSHILARISDSRKVIATRWIEVSEGFVTVETDAPADNERVFVTFVAMRDLERESETVAVVPYIQTVGLDIETETFRDRIEPGAPETWRFRFTYDGGICRSLPVMAVMSDKALDAIAPFRWAFNPYASLYWSPASRLFYVNRYSVSNGGSVSPSLSANRTAAFRIPLWNTYGYSLYSGNNIYCGSVSNDMMYKSAARSMGASKMEAAADGPEEVLNTVHTTSIKIRGTGATVEDQAAADSESGMASAPDNSVPLRETGCPKAFFMPSLVTDGDGVATVGFTAPDFVGTWQFQILGYTDGMKGSVLTLDAVSAKKVMASLNAPRFLRTGDRATVSATLFNNMETGAALSGRIEIADAVTGETILSEDFASENVAASGSRVITAWFAVPSETEALTVSVYALTDGHRDGEQTVVPVLPSNAPVVESTPFYIPAGSGSYEITLPEYDRDARVSLTYCDNPVWECVTALPSLLRPESVNILSQAEALYGNAVAAGLFRRYPKLIDGVREMADPLNAADSSLYSPLQKNASLKTVLLNNTPWVNDAKAETLRMQSLVQYADTAASRAAVDAVMKTLAERQLSDGGWSWCPEMKSSTFITGRVLHVLASLADMGYLPEGGDKLAGKAFGYMDRQLAEDWNRTERKYFSVTELLNYLYDKSAFRGIGSASAFKPLEAAAMKKIADGWRELTTGEMATAAMLLERRGMPKLSRLIMESLRQSASVSPEKGMWFDNLKSGYGDDNTLLTTARVLEAYAMIEPRNPAVDMLRQWMVMSKQTQNWGDNRNSAEAIHAVLSSGSDWTVPSSAPTVALGGKQIDMRGIASVTGSFVIDLDAKSASGKKLKVSRSASGPAWGGVVSQYVAPILDVRSASVPQISIEKQVYAVTPGVSGTTASAGNVKVGDRIRVTLTVTCDRDIEYVAVTDPRAACLEPVDQLSGYAQSDGVWFYREVRDSSTNIFIPFLSKGTHVISYDCTADRAGDYSLGVADAQSQYAPEITAHSAGALLPVE